MKNLFFKSKRAKKSISLLMTLIFSGNAFPNTTLTNTDFMGQYIIFEVFDISTKPALKVSDDEKQFISQFMGGMSISPSSLSFATPNREGPCSNVHFSSIAEKEKLTDFITPLKTVGITIDPTMTEHIKFQGNFSLTKKECDGSFFSINKKYLLVIDANPSFILLYIKK